MGGLVEERKSGDPGPVATSKPPGSSEAAQRSHTSGDPRTQAALGISEPERFPPIQRIADGAMTAPDPVSVAQQGVAGAGAPLPHLDRIQQSFGHHDVSDVRAHRGGEATASAQALGARAYAVGNDVAFAGAPYLHTAAHEAAHVVQQRQGVSLKSIDGGSSDPHEQHADRVADAVVAGTSAESLLDAGAGGASASKVVQRKPEEPVSTDASGYVTQADLGKQIVESTQKVGMVKSGPFGEVLGQSDVFLTKFAFMLELRLGHMGTERGALGHVIDELIFPEKSDPLINRARKRDVEVDPFNDQHAIKKDTGPVAPLYKGAVALEIANAISRHYATAIAKLFPQFVAECAKAAKEKTFTKQLTGSTPLEGVVAKALYFSESQLPMADLAAKHPEWTQFEADDKEASVRFLGDKGQYHWVEAAGATPAQVARALFKPNPQGDSASEQAFRLISTPPRFGFSTADISLFNQGAFAQLVAVWQDDTDARGQNDWPVDICAALGVATPDTVESKASDPIGELSRTERDDATAPGADASGKDAASVMARLGESLTVIDEIATSLDAMDLSPSELAGARDEIARHQQAAETDAGRQESADASKEWARADRQGAVLDDIATGIAAAATRFTQYHAGEAGYEDFRDLISEAVAPYQQALAMLELPELAAERVQLGKTLVAQLDIGVQEIQLHAGRETIGAHEKDPADAKQDWDADGDERKTGEEEVKLGALRAKQSRDPEAAQVELQKTSDEVADIEFDITLGDKLATLQNLWHAIDNEEDFWEGALTKEIGLGYKAQNKALYARFIAEVKVPYDQAGNDKDKKLAVRKKFEALLVDWKAFAEETNKFITSVEKQKKWAKIVVGIAIAVVAFSLGQFEFAGVLAGGGTTLEAAVSAGILTTATSTVLEKLILNQDPTLGSLITGFVGNVGTFFVVGKLALAARAAGVTAEAAESAPGAIRATKAMVGFTKEVVIAEAVGIVQGQAQSLIDHGRLMTSDEVQEALAMGVVNVIGMKVGQHVFDTTIDGFKEIGAKNKIDVPTLIDMRNQLIAEGHELTKNSGGNPFQMQPGKRAPRAEAQALAKKWQAYHEKAAELGRQLEELARKDPKAFQEKAKELSALKASDADAQSIAVHFREMRALLGVEELSPNLFSGDPNAMDAILAQHKAAGDAVVDVQTNPKTGQRTISFQLKDGSSLRVVEKLPDAGKRPPPKVEVGKAQQFEQDFLARIPDAKLHAQFVDYYARDPQAAVKLAEDHYGFIPGEAGTDQLVVKPDAPAPPDEKTPGKQKPGEKAPATDAEKAYDQYAKGDESAQKKSKDGKPYTPEDFAEMYKAGFDYDPIKGDFAPRRGATPAGNALLGHGDSGTAVIGTLPSEAVGHEVMRKLVAGEAEALRVVGIEPPEGFDPRVSEWGLGKRGEEIVLVRGGKGAVDWSLIPDVEDLGHSHPFVDPVTGKERLLAGQNGDGVLDVTKLPNDFSMMMDLLYLMPSTGDLRFVALNGRGGHRVFTPYVSLGEGKIGNPQPGGVHPTVEIQIVKSEAAGLLTAESDIVVYKGELQLYADGQKIGEPITLYQRYHDTGSFAMDAPTTEAPSTLAPLPKDHPIAKYNETPAAKVHGKVDAETVRKLVSQGFPDPEKVPSARDVLNKISKAQAVAIDAVAINDRVVNFEAWTKRIASNRDLPGALSDVQIAHEWLVEQPNERVGFDNDGRVDLDAGGSKKPQAQLDKAKLTVDISAKLQHPCEVIVKPQLHEVRVRPPVGKAEGFIVEVPPDTTPAKIDAAIARHKALADERTRAQALKATDPKAKTDWNGTKEAEYRGYPKAELGDHWTLGKGGRDGAELEYHNGDEKHPLALDKENNELVGADKRKPESTFVAKTVDLAFTELRAAPEFESWVKGVEKFGWTEARLLAEMKGRFKDGDIEGLHHRTVRHALKEVVNDRVVHEQLTKREWLQQHYPDEYRPPNALDKADERASYRAMIEFTTGLGSADRGSIAEKWYTEIHAGGEFVKDGKGAFQLDGDDNRAKNPNVDRHARFDAAVIKELEAEGAVKDGRVPDLIVDKNHLKDIKHVTGPLSSESVSQIKVYAKMRGKPLEAQVAGKAELFTVTEVTVVITDAAGITPNIDNITTFVQDGINFELFNRAGERRLFTGKDFLAAMADDTLPVPADERFGYVLERFAGSQPEPVKALGK